MVQIYPSSMGPETLTSLGSNTCSSPCRSLRAVSAVKVLTTEFVWKELVALAQYKISLQTITVKHCIFASRTPKSICRETLNTPTKKLMQIKSIDHNSGMKMISKRVAYLERCCGC